MSQRAAEEYMRRAEQARLEAEVLHKRTALLRDQMKEAENVLKPQVTPTVAMPVPVLAMPAPPLSCAQNATVPFGASVKQEITTPDSV